ncbi:hypothetical protein ACXJJ3_41775 [Kribbella sp. WER1]
MTSFDVGGVGLRELMAATVRAAMDSLAARHTEPVFDVQFDPTSWKRHGEESFAVGRHSVWRQPPETYSSDWIESFDAMQSLRKAVLADDELSQRLDVMVGTEFWRTRRVLADVVMYRLLAPMVLSTRTYRFDCDRFDELYCVLEPALLSSRVRWLDFVPINGLVLAAGLAVQLSGGLVLREMSDAEIAAALRVMAVPVERHDSPTSITISRLNQVALVLEHAHPFVAERDMPERPATPAVTEVDQAASLLITALRIVCGGSTAASRLLRLLHPDELESNGSAQAQLTQLGTVDPNRRVVLFAEQTVDLVQVFHLLTAPVGGALGVAIRRLGLTSGRTHAADRLVDLIICAEALFIHHIGIRGRSQSDAIARGAAGLLGSDPVLGASADAIDSFMRAAYRRRNGEVHGDPSPGALLLGLDGGRVTDLGFMVEDLDRIMRRACWLALDQVRDDS